MPDNEGVRWLFKENFDFDTVPEAADWEIYAKSILICANGDGEIADAERQWVIGMAAAHGAPAAFRDMLRTWTPSGDHTELLESRQTGMKSKRSFVYHAVQACSADGEYHASERAAVRRLAAPLGISGNVVGEIEQLVQDEKDIRARRLQVLFADAGKPF